VLDEDGWTLLYYACMNNDSRSPVIPLFLAHPDIDVNVKDKGGQTPFNGRTPLWIAAFYGDLNIIKWWIASGREMDLGMPGDDATDAIGAAKERSRREVVTLLEGFKSDAA